MRCALALLLGMALPASAVPILDQEAVFDGGTLWHDNDSRGNQTFTVATTGTLVQLDLWVVANVGFRECGQTGLCSVSVLGPASAASAAFLDPDPGWLTLIFAPLAVTAGDVLRFQIRHEGILGFGSAVYDRGELTHACGVDPCIDPLLGDPSSPLPGETILPLSVDYAFRAWIEPTVVPEPGLLALLAAGLAMPLRRRTH